MLSSASSVKVFLFGDQTTAFESDLRSLLHTKDHPTLCSFFEKANYALRCEVARLPCAQRERFPRFTCILDLLQHYQKTGGNPALGLSLLTLNHLARFIKYYGEDSRPYPLASQSYSIGLCTGSFAAAAISTSQTISELIPAALEAVMVSFRTGLASLEARGDIEESEDEASAVWSVIVGLKEEQAKAIIDAFLASKSDIPMASRPYLSAVNSSSVTLSGPPSVLDEILKATNFTALRPIKLPVHAPYHSPHVYSIQSIEGILASSDKRIVDTYMPRMPVISCSTGRRIDVPTYRLLLRQVLQDVLTEQLRWDSVLAAAPEEFTQNHTGSLFSIFPVLTNAAPTLAAALSQATRARIPVENVLETLRDSSSSDPTGKPEQSKIAIVGHSGRFPDAASTEEFWKLLHSGLDVHREIPADRFDMKAHFDPTGKKKNTSRIKHGCFIKEPGLFDARFFNMSPRESCQADPGQRLAITTAYEAMEMAGFVPDRTPSSQRDRIGIFYGMTSDDWREVNSGQNVDTYFIPGGNRAFTPGRINYHFKFSGPSFSIDTACSSSFAAIHTACNSLWRGDCDMAIAGGTNVMTNPDNFAGLDRGHFLSTTGNCNTFDDGANGYCRADAVGTVILKRLEDAQADKDPIYGVLLGAYTNHSAEADSMTRPHVGAQAFIFNSMLNKANIDPLDVSYIEMHGTGTQTGDAVEMKSVLEVFAKKPRGTNHPLYLGSAKANIGHAESASGVASLIKVLKMMEKSEIPPHCGIKTKINHGFPMDLQARNVNIALSPTPWNRPAKGKRVTFLNNFSAAGGNTALLLEDAPIRAAAKSNDGRSSHIVAISAKCILSLEKNIQNMISFLQDSTNTSLPALSYTTTARRLHYNHRITVTGSDISAITSALQQLGSTKDVRPIQTSKIPKMAFVFTGQGSLYSGMAKEFYETISQFRSDVHRFDRIAQSQGFPTFLPLVDGSGVSIDDLGPVAAQVGAAAVQMALTRLWSSWGVRPSLVIGHSLGEYAALHAAGVLSVSDTIYLTGSRAQLLVKCCTVGTHSMLAVKASPASVNSYLSRTTCEIACINGPDDTVLSGAVAEIASLSADLIKAGIKCMKLEVPFAFHSAQVEIILQKFEALARDITFKKPEIPFISPLLGEVVTEENVLGPAYLSRACRETVNFHRGLSAATAAGFINEKTIFVEIGAHPVCSGMVKSTIGSTSVTIPTLRKGTNTWKVITESLACLHLAGIEIQWNEYHRDFEGCQEVIDLPAYHWDAKNYWIQGNQNNFCLTKGESSSSIASEHEHTLLPKAYKSLTTSVQRVLDESHSKQVSTILIESDMSEAVLSRSVQGHKVNGVALCPSSLYADMAVTIGEYLLKESESGDQSTGVDVAEMKVSNPLIASGAGPQLLRVSASADWATQTIEMAFYSVSADGKKTVDHAKCKARIGSRNDWSREFNRNSYLIKSRIEALQRGVDDGHNHKLKRSMAYKLFGAVVEYGKSYQGMEEVILDSQLYEATATVKFQSSDADGNFAIGPYHIDSLGHIAGFIMNGNDRTDTNSQVFVNHGWDRMRCTSAFSTSEKYQTYNRMQNIGGTLFSGDTYILHEGAVIAVFEGIKFQGVPASVLDNLLSSKTPSKPRKATPPVLVPTKSPNIGSSDTLAPPNASRQIPIIKEPLESSRPSLAARALSIVAEEVGLEISDLLPTSSFSDFGVDSLLSLNIASRFREELDLDVESSLFSDYPTVKEFMAFLPGGNVATSVASTATTPGLEHSSVASSTTDETECSTIAGIENYVEDSNVLATIRLTIAEEVGIPVEELTSSLAFSDVGMDSLLSLTVLGKLREVLDVDLPASIFQDNKSIEEVEIALGLRTKEHLDTSQLSTFHPITINIEPPRSQEIVLRQESALSHPPASSIILQGNAKTASRSLFLFPDGSGSATSYAPLPKVSSDLVVYGLNCPYMKNPGALKCSLEKLTPSYIAEIRRRQPHGPYYFGGWSAGGISAFDAAQQLDHAGERVAKLVLIDTPFPVGLEKLPPRLYDFFNSIGLFGSSSNPPPAWLLPHFLAFIDCLDKYRVVPFRSSTAPEAHIIWAQDGVCKDPQDPRPEMGKNDPREMKWLLNNRTDFRTDGWADLVGRGKVEATVMSDANHFSMMEGQKAVELAGWLKRVLES